MLLSLHIENYAIIKSLQITFDSGFTAITGETGAGKSILIGALSLILGNRVDTSILYDRTKKCYVEGSFNIEKLDVKHFFDKYDLDYLNITLLRREISESGKSRAFINDTPVTLVQLKELAQYLVDIHSQHHHLLLENQDFKIKIIDEFSNNSEKVALFQNKLIEFKKCHLELDSLLEEQAKSIQDKDYLEFLSNELFDAHIIEGEQEELEKQITILSNAEMIKSKLFFATNSINNEQINLLGLLYELKSNFQSIASFDVRFVELLQRIESLNIDLKDIDYEINNINSEIEVNPDQLQLLIERLDLLMKLQQKHRVSSITELIEKKNSIDQKLSQFIDNQNNIDIVEKRKLILFEELNRIGDEISSVRKQNIPKLEKAIIQNIVSIGIPDGLIKIQIESTNQFFENGKDRVNLLFSANKGIPLAEVEKVASGGEMSRLMLAIKSVITANNFLPTVIFDEIDTGISGDIAGKVARLMQQIASDRQLLTITHLPQIAAKASLHYFVYKEVIDEKTYTNVRALSPQERVDEIAAMLSGDTVTEAARWTAKELIYEK